jgi:ketosteroid isomerase-like protein
MTTIRIASIVSVAALLATAGVAGCARMAMHRLAHEALDHSGEQHADVLAANEAFYAAINRLMAGSADGMDAVWSHSPDVSDFGPDGKRHVGWPAVEGQFRAEAALKMGGSITCEDVKVVQAGDHAIATCLERGNGAMIDGKVVELRFRSTNVFRREGDAWKMVHHHTDPSPALTPKPPR